MKLSRIIDPRFKPTLEKLFKQPLPIKTAYKMRGSIQKLDEELKKYDELYQLLITKYADKKDDGTVNYTADGKVTISQDKIAEANQELFELQNIDISIDRFTVDELGQDLELTVEDLLVLDDFIL